MAYRFIDQLGQLPHRGAMKDDVIIAQETLDAVIHITAQYVANRDFHFPAGGELPVPVAIKQADSDRCVV